MSLPKHARYKDSGVTWLGKVPQHWEIRRVGYYFSERREKVSDKEFPPLSVTKNGVVPQLETAAKTDDGDNRKLVRRGDFVINGRSDRKGSSGTSEADGSVSLINTVLTPTAQMSGRFAHHLFRSVPFQEEYYRFGKGIVADLWSTSYSEMRNITLAVPAYTEQVAIAHFLDRETAKIDVLIAEQEKLLALLAEKRRATISHAVTRGLNPDASLRDSAIAWLGQVPAHWGVKPLKRVARLITGMTPPTGDEENYAVDGYPWLRPEDLDESGFPSLASKSLSAKGWDGARHVAPNSSLICCIGTIGKVGFVSTQVSTNQQITSAEFMGDGRYFYYVTCAARGELELSATGNVLRILNSERLGGICYPSPNAEEQIAIGVFLDGETTKLDKLSEEAVQGISLLKERRSALIAAAVTGQIDVRGAVETQAA